MIGLADIFGDTIHPINLGRPFRQRRKHLAIIHFLEGFPIHHVAANLTDKQNHGRGILIGDMHPGRGVCRAGATGDETDAGLPRQFSMGIGHHRRTAFLAAYNRLNFRHVIQTIQDRQIAFPRDQKNPSASLRPQLIGQDAPTMTHGALSGNAHLIESLY